VTEKIQEDLFSADENNNVSVISPKQFKIVKISKGVAASVYLKHHYFGDKDFLALYSFGATYTGNVWGAITYGIPNPHSIKGLYDKTNQHGVVEITRLAFKKGSPKNSCSYLIAQSIKALKKYYPVRLIITYADTAYNHTGAIYKAANFDYHGLTDPKTDFVFPDGQIRKVKGLKYSEAEGFWVPRSRKHRFSKQVA
jgi:hypothetical protein